MLVTVGVTLKFKVATESQPAALVKVVVWLPAALNVKPFHAYGNWSSHIVILVVLVTVGVTVKFIVATESQPAAVVKVAVWLPEELNVKPFHVYGNWSSHIVRLVLLVTTGLTVKFKVATESQPAALLKVAVWLPAALNVKPFQL